MRMDTVILKRTKAIAFWNLACFECSDLGVLVSIARLNASINEPQCVRCGKCEAGHLVQLIRRERRRFTIDIWLDYAKPDYCFEEGDDCQDGFEEELPGIRKCKVYSKRVID